MPETVRDTADDAVRAALSTVHDPCSAAAGSPLSIVDMGLVRSWRSDGSVLTVTICVTTKGCTMVGHIIRAIGEAVRSARPDIERVDVEVDPTVFWTPDELSSRGKRVLALRHAGQAVRPRQWAEV